MEKRIVFILIISVVACKKPYNPPAISASGSYLVVEGVINSGPDSTFIKLSRTVNIGSNTIIVETGAKVTLESDQNAIYTLTEKTAGTYGTAPLNLDNTRKYRVRIITPDNKQYLSNLEAVVNTPPIDSVGYTLTNTGMIIYANAHDATNTAKYYRWDYSEAWHFHSDFASEFEVIQGGIVPRVGADQVFDCFTGDSSSNITLGSTADLKQAQIYRQPITNILATSEKLEDRYTILLHQYALTPDAFNFWTNLKKNTEQLGSIFDAEPSQATGNIHCISNPAEPVVGYISITDTQNKRIFISNSSLPSSFFPVYPYACGADTIKTADQDQITSAPVGTIYIIGPASSKGKSVGWLVTSPLCADCTLRGSKTPPPFWK